MNYSKLFAWQIVGLLLLMHVSLATALADDGSTAEAESVDLDTEDTADSSTSEETSTESEEVSAEEQQAEPVGDETGGTTPLTSSGDEEDPYYGLRFSAELGEEDNVGEFQNSLFTCSGTYLYPVRVPPGTNGLTPEIVISYNSHGAKGGNGLFGLGWSLSEHYIQRDVNGTAGDSADDEFILNLLGQSHDLIHTGGNRYHSKIESHLYIENSSGSGLNEGGDYWIVRDTSGTVYRFGYKNDSERLGPNHAYVSRWYLDQIKDTHGNVINYSYLEDPFSEDINATYPDTIVYNTEGKRRIDFGYGTVNRPDLRVLFEQGLKVQKSRLLQEINVSADDALVRSYHFDYDVAQYTNASLLSNITLIGNDGSSTLPPVLFSYEPLSPAFQDLLPWESFDNVLSYTHHTEREKGLVDLNGDGLVDFVKTTRSCLGCDWHVYFNNGSGFSPTGSRNWNFPDAFWSYLRQTSIYGVKQEIIDMNGDGLPDLVSTNNTDRWFVYLNNGTGFEDTPLRWQAYNNYILSTYKDVRLSLLDLNGDGLPDQIEIDSYSGTPGYDWKVYFNNGTGFENTASANWNFPGDYFYSYIRRLDPNTDGIYQDTIDMNGDGLPDYVATNNSNRWFVYLNNGTGFEEEPIRWQAYDTRFFHTYYQTRYSLIDMNADGLLDYVKSDYNGATGEDWNVYFNNGTGFAPSPSENWLNLPPYGTYVQYTPLVGEKQGLHDINGDGFPDLIRANSSNTWNVYLNNNSGYNLLVRVENSNGGEVNVSYTPSTRFDNTGDDDIPDLKQVYWCVNETVHDNGLSGAAQVTSSTTYAYGDGLYDWEDDEFRGFGWVRVSDDSGREVSHSFHQDDGRKGRERLTVTWLGSKAYQATYQFWDDAESGGVHTVTRSEVKKLFYDGDNLDPRVTRTLYDYDEYGNPTLVSHLGETEYDGTDIAGDEKYEEFAYTYNVGDWIVDMPAYRLLKDGNQITVEGSYFLYDHHYNLFDPPTHGDVTKRVDLNDGYTDPVTEYDYDEYGNVVWEKDSNNHVTTYAYDSATHTFPVSESRPLSHTYTYDYDLGTGNLNWVEDPNGYRTSYEYDSFGRKTAEIRPYDSPTYPTVEIQHLDSQFPRGVVSKKRDGGASTLDSYVFRDGFGRTVQSRGDAEDGGQQVVVDTFYDELGRVAAESNPHFDAYSSTYQSPVPAPASNYSYDALDRRTRVVNPDGTNRTTDYLHWVETVTDENGHVKKFYRDAYDRVVKVEEFNGGEVYATVYGYDGADNLVNITDYEGNVFLFEYDMLGRRTALSDPDLGDWSYAYDAVGNLVSQTDARGVSTSYTYDALDRVIVVDYPSDSDVVHTYDSPVLGTLSSTSYGGLTLDYDYDERLRKTGESWTTPDGSWNLSWTYDSMDRPTSFATPRDEMIYGYNNQGLLDEFNAFLPHVSYGFDYDAFGAEISRTNYIIMMGFPIIQSKSYDPHTHRLTRMYSHRLSNPLQDWRFGYDAVGNIVGMNETVEGLLVSYGYDDLDRLTSAVNAGSSPYTRSFTYSPIGNLLSASEDGLTINYRYGQGAGPHAVTSLDGCTGSAPPENGVWTVSSSTSCGKSAVGVDDVVIEGGNQLTLSGSSLNVNNVLHVDGTLSLKDTSVGLDSGDDLEYDANGNLVRDGSFTYVFDEANRLVEVYDGGELVASYAYTADGIRYLKETYDEEGTTKTYSIGDSFEVKFLPDSSQEFTTYYRGNGELLARKDNDNSLHYYLNDHLGGTHIILDPYGELEERTTYYPFGGVLSGGDSRFTYTGQESDKETGLMYYKARYYNPELRRFTQPDTVIQDYYDPQTLNRYTYVRNNPIKYNDPTGHVAWAIPALVGAIGGLGYYAFSPGEKTLGGAVAHAGYGAGAAVVGTYAAAAAGTSYLAAAFGGAVSSVLFEGSTEIHQDGIHAKGTATEIVFSAGKGAVLGGAIKLGGDKIVKMAHVSQVKVVFRNGEAVAGTITLKSGEVIEVPADVVLQIYEGYSENFEEDQNPPPDGNTNTNTPTSHTNNKKDDNTEDTEDLAETLVP